MIEKRAIVEAGKTPSEISGKPSTMIKNGKALAAGEKDDLTPAENRLANTMRSTYTDS